MMQSEQVNEVATALALAQGEIKPAAKDAENPHFRSKYADLASVWEACRVALSKHGLSVVQQPFGTPEGERLRTVLFHKSGQWIASECALLGDLKGMQPYGSALTYARRYGLAAMVGVVADEDDDGNAAQAVAKSPRRAPRQDVPDESPDKASKRAIYAALQRIGAVTAGMPDDEKREIARAYCGWALKQDVESVAALSAMDLTECASKIGALTKPVNLMEG